MHHVYPYRCLNGLDSQNFVTVAAVADGNHHLYVFEEARIL
jgi:hypothetical protein